MSWIIEEHWTDYNMHIGPGGKSIPPSDIIQRRRRYRQGIIQGWKVHVSIYPSDYTKAVEIAELLADEVRRGEFPVAPPLSKLPVDQSMKGLQVRRKEER